MPVFKKLFSSTKSATEGNTKLAEAPKQKAEEAPVPVSEEQREAGDGREVAASTDITREAAEKFDAVVAEAEATACANDNVKAAVNYALANGKEGDVIDQVFSEVEKACSPQAYSDEELIKCTIQKDSKEEKLGISLRTSLNSDGIYVHRIDEGSKFESTKIEVGHKVVLINGEETPFVLTEAIDMLKNAEGELTLDVTTNDEAVNQISEMAEMGTDVTFNQDLTKIAVDGYADSCGFLWSIQNGICAFAPTPAIEAETIVEEEDKKEEVVEEVKEETETKSLVDEPEKKKKKSFFKKFSSRKSKKAPVVEDGVVEEKKEEEPVAKEEEKTETKEAPEGETEKEEEKKEIAHPEGSIVIKVEKDTLEESLGLAIRDSTVNKKIYVYGIFPGSKLKDTELAEKMLIVSINGKEFSEIEDAINEIKASKEVEIVAAPNDEEKPKEESNKNAGWGFLWW